MNLGILIAVAMSLFFAIFILGIGLAWGKEIGFNKGFEAGAKTAQIVQKMKEKGKPTDFESIVKEFEKK